MHLQVITYTVSGMTEAEWQRATEPAAPIIGAMPGLIAKTWLADPATNTYGGVYLWESVEDSERYLDSDFVRDFAANPAIADLTARTFAVWEEHSRITRGAAPVTA
jgi:hypothetical protein